MGDFDSLCRMEIGAGPTPASFTLTKYSYKSAPVVGAQVVGLGSGPIVGKSIVIEGEGYVAAATPAALIAAVGTLKTAMDVSGSDVVIYGPGDEIEHTILHARSIEGGPHFYFEFGGDGGNLLRRVVKFRVEAQTLKVPGGGGDDEEEDGDNYEQTDSIRADGLRTVTRKAEIWGPNLQSRLDNNVRPALRAGFDSTHWVITEEVVQGSAQDKLNYTLTATELNLVLPASATANAWDMTVVKRRERDERHRLVETWEFDVLATGDSQRIIDDVRQEFIDAGHVVTRENTSVSEGRELRIRVSFSTLRSADGNTGLLDWSQSFRLVGNDAVYDVKRYPGLSPVLVQRPTDVVRLVQSGTAIAVGAPVDAPAPVFATLLEPREVEQVALNAYEYATRWNYVMLAPGFTINVAALRRPR